MIRSKAHLHSNAMFLFKHIPVQWLVPSIPQVGQGSIKLVLLQCDGHLSCKAFSQGGLIPSPMLLIAVEAVMLRTLIFPVAMYSLRKSLRCMRAFSGYCNGHSNGDAASRLQPVQSAGC